MGWNGKRDGETCMKQLPKFILNRAQRDHEEGSLNFTRASLNEMSAPQALVILNPLVAWFLVEVLTIA